MSGDKLGDFATALYGRPDPDYDAPLERRYQDKSIEDIIKDEIKRFIIQHLNTINVTDQDKIKITTYLKNIIGPDKYNDNLELIHKLLLSIPVWFKGRFVGKDGEGGVDNKGRPVWLEPGTYIQDGGRISKRVKNRRTTRRKKHRNNKKSKRCRSKRISK